MKKIEAFVRTSRLHAIKEALNDLGILGMTVTEVTGLGEQTGYREIYRGNEYEVNFLPRLKIELLVSDRKVSVCVEAIANAARTGNVGDGKILVLPVESVMRIRTGEVDEAATSKV